MRLWHNCRPCWVWTVDWRAVCSAPGSAPSPCRCQWCGGDAWRWPGRTLGTVTSPHGPGTSPLERESLWRFSVFQVIIVLKVKWMELDCFFGLSCLNLTFKIRKAKTKKSSIYFTGKAADIDCCVTWASVLPYKKKTKHYDDILYRITKVCKCTCMQ